MDLIVNQDVSTRQIQVMVTADQIMKILIEKVKEKFEIKNGHVTVNVVSRLTTVNNGLSGSVDVHITQDLNSPMKEIWEDSPVVTELTKTFSELAESEEDSGKIASSV